MQAAARSANVAADSIVLLTETSSATLSAIGISTVTNPFPSQGGADEEPAERVRQLAPFAFRNKLLRAVRPEDYEQAAESLPWVQRAGTIFRWTGSWLTVFTTVDPIDSIQIQPTQRIELTNLLNRRRMAGYESYIPDPIYVALDLEITVCAQTTAFHADVEAELLLGLSTFVLPNGQKGFFHPDNFTFGTPLERSALEAAIQDCFV